MMEAVSYKPKSPEWTLAMFFDCWRRRAWQQMLAYTQYSWVADYGEMASRFIKAALRGRFVSAEFIQRNNTTSVAVEYLIKIRYKTWGRDAVGRSKISKIKLIHNKGAWGVVPESVM